MVAVQLENSKRLSSASLDDRIELVARIWIVIHSPLWLTYGPRHRPPGSLTLSISSTPRAGDASPSRQYRILVAFEFSRLLPFANFHVL